MVVIAQYSCQYVCIENQYLKLLLAGGGVAGVLDFGLRAALVALQLCGPSSLPLGQR